MCVGVLFFVAENKKGFVLYADLIHTVSKLPREIKGDLFQLILDYVNDKDPQTDDLLLEVSFEPIKQQLKRDLVKWEKFREKQSLNGKRGGRPKNPSLFNESQKSLKVKVTDTVIVTDKDNVKDTVKVNRVFTPPTILEVKSYCLERGNSVDAEKWVNHYQSNGWMVGKNKMKDWRAAVRTWEKNEFNKNNNGANKQGSGSSGIIEKHKSFGSL